MTQQIESRSRTAGPIRDRRWLRWGAAVLAADLVIHAGGGTLTNDWEGWGVFWVNVTFVLVTGVVICGMTYGVVARWALRRGHAAGAALGTGIASLVSYPIFFTWAPLLIAPAAFLLARVELRSAGSPRRRRMALTGAAFALGTFAVFVWFLVVVLLTGAYPDLPLLGPLNPGS
jgi:hypothetical protein